MADNNQTDSKLIVFEYIEVADNVNGFVLKPISASEAFRRFDWLKMEPVLNKSGNLRGMVINRNMRTVYQFSKQAGDKLAVVGALIEMGMVWSRAKKVYSSDMEGIEKYRLITLLFSASVLRSVTSIVPTAVEIGALSLKGYGDIYSAVTGSPAGLDFGRTVQDFAKQVRTTHSRQWDGENWYNIIKVYID